MKNRFRGFYPVVVDIETAGFDAKKDAILEIAAVLIEYDAKQGFYTGETLAYHVEPFASANLDAKALEFTGIDPYHPFRFAKPEKEVLQDLFKKIRAAQKKQGCQRTVMVAHNAMFDMSFLQAMITRTENKKSPFHPFTAFDTATLAATFYGQTVLAKAMQKAGIAFNEKEAHSAIYDAQKTAELFCLMMNRAEPQL